MATRTTVRRNLMCLGLVPRKTFTLCDLCAAAGSTLLDFDTHDVVGGTSRAALDDEDADLMSRSGDFSKNPKKRSR